MSDDVTDLTRGVYRRQYAGFIGGKRISRLSLEAEAWFWRVHAVADDFGNVAGEPSLLYAATIGRRVGEFSMDAVEQFVAAMIDVGLVSVYAVAGDRYLHLIGFETMQPAGKNGKRVRRVPPSPSEGVTHAWRREPDPSLSDAGGSGCIQINPGVLSASDSDSDTHSDSEELKTPIPPPAARADATSLESDTSAGRSPQGDPQHGQAPAPKRAARSSPEDDALPGFARFWAEVPARRKAGQSDCRRHWDRAGLEAIADQVLAGLARWKASADWSREDGQFIKAPLPWLRAESWHAEPTPARNRGPNGHRPDARNAAGVRAGEFPEPAGKLAAIAARRAAAGAAAPAGRVDG